MNTISIFKQPQQDDSPVALAIEHAEAKRQYEAVRADVIQRGVTRVQEIEALKAELSEEQAQLDEAVEAARQGITS